MASANLSPDSPVVKPAPPAYEVRLVGHSNLLYWWPLWFFGYLFALIIYFNGHQVNVNDGPPLWFHSNQHLGVFYTIVLFSVIMITNMTLRGQSSYMFILAVMFGVVLAAYLGWWQYILEWAPHLSIFMNLGFYVFFSSLIFVPWLLSFLFFDRASIWRIRSGQVTNEHLIGGGNKSFDTEGMVVEKLSEDLFRHVLLGFGSGDIRISPKGGMGKESTLITNVLFADRKVAALQRLVATKPDQVSAVAM